MDDQNLGCKCLEEFQKCFSGCDVCRIGSNKCVILKIHVEKDSKQKCIFLPALRSSWVRVALSFLCLLLNNILLLVHLTLASMFQ